MTGWALTGPAPTPVEEARRMLYTATGGAEGVGGVNDLKVVPLEVPGQGVRVLPGTALIRSLYASAGNESYQGSVNQQVALPTTPTGSTPSSGRSDLVVMRAEDPWAENSPWPEPSDPLTYEGFPVRVIEGVPAGTTRLQDVPGHQNDSAVTLARIDFPPSTGTVVAGMIVDLREIARPRRSEVVFARPRVAEDDSPQNYLTGTMDNGGEFFPGGGGYANEFQVLVPEWATRVIIDAKWMSVYYGANRNPYGSCWIEFGDEYRNHTWPNKQQYEFTTQRFNWNAPITSDERTANWLVMDEVAVPAKLRGKIVTFVFKAGYAGNPGGSNHTWMSSSGGLGCRLTFAERAVDTHIL